KDGEPVDAIPFTEVQRIVYQRCTPCHASVPYPPPGAKYTEPPNGVLMETPEQINALVDKIQSQVESGAMPLGNLTRITKEERELLAKWADQKRSSP
ncbi:MAG: hypothetical protein WC423_20205, partial [Vulcanimicrobiota bacterium]